MFGREGFGRLDGASFAKLVERLLWHLDFENVTNVDGAGDQGADLLADRHGESWVFQCKWKSGNTVGESAVQETINAVREYGSSRAAVVTNNNFSEAARRYAASWSHQTGLRLGLWSGGDLETLWADDQNCAKLLRLPNLRPYQADAFAATKADLREKSRAFLVLATGLGKTMVAGALIQSFLTERPDSTVLVVAHARELVDQLQRAMWRHVSKNTPVQQLTSDEKPDFLDGVTCATFQSALPLVRLGWRPDFVFVDEAHHVGDDGQYAELLELCRESKQLGVTATPWRGDQGEVAAHFGGTTYRLGIEEGMRLGYLCDVRYKVFADNIDWAFVRSISRNSYSLKELNSRLFIPQRDERIRDELLGVWNSTVNPRAIVFCQTIEHAKRMREILGSVPVWRNAQAIHNEMGKRERQISLMRFRRGEIPILIAVDVLNEGVDVPDVNIVCFARVTHSRRIFVQQLGRGLRLSDGKDYVSVLDFISDIARVAEIMNLRRSVTSDVEDIFLPSSHSIEFEDRRVEGLMSEWLLDVADIETSHDQARFNFPEFLG